MYQFNPEDAREFARSMGAKTQTIGDELIFEHCPYCGAKSEKRSNKNKFAINLKTGQFHCFRASCNANGNMITLSRDFGFPLPGYADEYYNHRKKYADFRNFKRPVPTDPAVEYMASRGIPAEICRKYEITTDAKNPDLLIFPFYDEDNTLQLIKYRNLKANRENGLTKEWVYKDQKNDLSCKPILFGMNHCDTNDDTLIMTEGQIDSLSVVAAGFKNSVSVPLGCNGFTWVPYCWNWLQRFKKLIVFGDHEHDRITLLEDMQHYFNGTVLHVKPEDYKDCKDANEILQKHGADQIVRCIENATPAMSKNFVKLSEIRPKPVSEMECFPTGIKKLDQTLGGLYFGQLVILTGDRGEGKSTLSNQLALQAVQNQVRTLIYSGELPNGSLRDWIDTQAAGPMNMNTLTDRFGEKYYKLKSGISDKVAEWYSDYLWIYQNQFLEDADHEEEKSIIDLITDAAKEGFRFIIIDNLMTAMDDDVHVDLYRAQTQFVKQLVRLAKARDILIMLIAHQRKSIGTNRTADDVAGSANITNLADVVMTFGKAKTNAAIWPRELTVQKNRLTGKIGTPIPIWYDASSRRVNDKQDFDWSFGWEPEFLDLGDVKNPFEEVIFGDN